MIGVLAGVAFAFGCGAGEDICVAAAQGYSCSACTLELCEDADHACTWYQASDGTRFEAGCPLDGAEGVAALSQAKAHCGCR